MNNENMYEEVSGELVDAVNTDICDSSNGFFPSQISGKHIAITAGVGAVAVAGITGIALWLNRDKLRERKLRRLEEKARKYGLTLVDAGDCENENED